ncbi:AMP-binding protein [Falsiroseomonas sp. HC035]|uniref:AMP-binding protein n=1 Tax=Falsiroseomonas sp. HC035 TaxID=3390999 RepID=UPI003D31D06E
MTDALLPPGLLDRPVLRHWRQGERHDMTGRALWQRATALAAWIEARAPPGGLVLVVGASGPQVMAVFLGIVAAGRVASCFPPASPRQDPAHFFAQQRSALRAVDPAAICVLDAASAEMVRSLDPALAARVLVVPADARADGTGALEVLRARLESDAPLFVQHSSGTTGLRKAVPVSGRMLAGQFVAYWPGLRAEVGVARLSVASWLPLYHDMGLLAGFLLPVLGGDCVSVLDPFEWVGAPGRFLELIAADGCDICWMPNFAFRHFIRLRRALRPPRLDAMRLWVDCSEPCRLADAQGFEQAFADCGVRQGSVVGCYAMAETVFAASQGRAEKRLGLAVPPGLAVGEDLAGASLAPEGEGLVLSSGRPLPGVDIAVFDGDRALAPGHYGEIGLRAGFLFAGYRGRSAPDSGIGADGWFRTGDLGAVLQDQLFVFGRIKEIVIVNGRNIFVHDVEATLAEVPGLKAGRIVAFGLDSDQTGSEELVVVAEHDPAAGVALAACRAAASRHLADTLLVTPRDVRIVEGSWLVKAGSGKISRDENRRRYVAQFRQDQVRQPE